MLRHALVGVVAEVAEAVVRCIVGALDEVVEVRLIAELLRCHRHDLAVIAAHAHFLRHELSDLAAAAAILTRDRDKSVLFHSSLSFQISKTKPAHPENKPAVHICG